MVLNGGSEVQSHSYLQTHFKCWNPSGRIYQLIKAVDKKVQLSMYNIYDKVTLNNSF